MQYVHSKMEPLYQRVMDFCRESGITYQLAGNSIALFIGTPSETKMVFSSAGVTLEGGTTIQSFPELKSFLELSH